MPYDIKLDPITNDLFLQQNANGNYDIALIDGIERVRQMILITLQTWLGEWVFDTTIGVPYLQNILVKNPNIDMIEGLLRTQILAVDDVAAVTSMTATFDRAARTLSVAYTVQSDVGIVSDVVALVQPRNT